MAAGEPVVVVLGVSASGKSLVGAALAQRMGVSYADGDDFHSEANVAKMRASQPLDDADREPWLEAIRGWLVEQSAAGGVVSCSALRRDYRAMLLAAAPATTFLHLVGRRELIQARIAERTGHFMPPALLDSQLAELEPLGSAEPGLEVDVDQPVDAVVAEFLAWWRGNHGGR